MTLQQTGGLFTDYIIAFIRLKQKDCGYPNNVQTNDQKATCVRKYFKHERILFKKDFIQKIYD